MVILCSKLVDELFVKILSSRHVLEFCEGFLTKLKSRLVSRRTLEIIADKIEVSRVLRYDKNLTIKLETIQGNAFEAIIGAIFLDGGYTSAENSLKKLIR